MAPSRKPIKLAEALGLALGELGMSRELKKWQLVRDFPKLVGEPIGTHARAWRVAEDVVYVEVDNSTWLSQLHLIKDQIVKKLNAGAGEELIRDVRFTLRS
jgi:predicted nucleic acid-binding Zn ribbon protein